MKKFIAGFLVGLAVCFILFRIFPSVSEPAYLDERVLDEHVAVYNQGYVTGYDAGYNNGLANAPKMVEHLFKKSLKAICEHMNEAYGLHPDDAMNIIMQYADGEPIESDELITALRVAWGYYNEANDCIEAIDAYNLD